MWLYSQSTGILWDDRGLQRAEGYSGHGKGKNTPKHEAIKNVGPIPRGLYVIGEPYDSANIGPHALPLYPSGHDCLGRTFFRIHGDSISNPGNASRGCVILNRREREFIHNSTDRIFKVIE